jgi:farnesyl-diphosphate farnesyltransferase
MINHNIMLYFYLSPQQKEYLEGFMNTVSRSFAMVTPCFEEPLDVFMSTAYLICRVVDNIEDCKQPFSWQQRRFTEFKQLLQEPTLAQEILSTWSNQDWAGLNVHQKALMQLEGGLMLWQIYELIPDSYSASISQWALAMASGMEQILDPQQKPSLLEFDEVSVLATEADYNTYCYIVAGTVGRMGTELAINHYHLDSKIAQTLLIGSETCGRALQKTNIIKDFAEDLKGGKCYLPNTWLQEIDISPLRLDGAPKNWIKEVLIDVKADLDKAVSYVMAIPYQAAGYRLASLMCLLPAYQTLLSAAQQQDLLFTAKHNVKISRSCFSQCFEDAKLMVRDNEALVQYSQQLHNDISATFKNSHSTLIFP